MTRCSDTPEKLSASESNAVRAWIAKWPAVSFYLRTLTLSWGYWLTLLGQGRRVVPGSVVTHFPGLLGPMLAAMAVTAVIGGRKGLHELLGRMFRLGLHLPSSASAALSCWRRCTLPPVTASFVWRSGMRATT